MKKTLIIFLSLTIVLLPLLFRNFDAYALENNGVTNEEAEYEPAMPLLDEKTKDYSLLIRERKKWVTSIINYYEKQDNYIDSWEETEDSFVFNFDLSNLQVPVASFSDNKQAEKSIEGVIGRVIYIKPESQTGEKNNYQYKIAYLYGWSGEYTALASKSHNALETIKDINIPLAPGKFGTVLEIIKLACEILDTAINFSKKGAVRTAVQYFYMNVVCSIKTTEPYFLPLVYVGQRRGYNRSIGGYTKWDGRYVEKTYYTEPTNNIPPYNYDSIQSKPNFSNPAWLKMKAAEKYTSDKQPYIDVYKQVTIPVQ